MGVNTLPKKNQKAWPSHTHSFCPRGTNSTCNQLVLEVVHEWQQLAATVPVADNPEDEVSPAGRTDRCNRCCVAAGGHSTLKPGALTGAAAPQEEAGEGRHPRRVTPRGPWIAAPFTPWSSQGPWEPTRPHQTQQMLQGPEVQEHQRPMHQLRPLGNNLRSGLVVKKILDVTTGKKLVKGM